MGRLDFIRGVPAKIREFGNDASVRFKKLARDGPALRSIAGDLSREIVLKTVPGARWGWKFWHKTQSGGSSSGELKDLRERISKLSGELKDLRERISKLSGDLKDLRESKNTRLKGMEERVSRLESKNLRLKRMGERVCRLESENSSLKKMSERIPLLECEISSVREEKKEWQQERIMLMASMLALATDAETKSWKSRALLLTMSDLLLPSDHSVIRAEAKPEDCIQL